MLLPLPIRAASFGKNASGIGAKVRVTANIHGQTVTQLRTTESPGNIGSNQGFLAHIGLADAFDTIVASEDTDRHKPDPDPFLEAARRLGARPERCVVWEDSDLGLEAARRGGMAWIDVRAFHLPARVGDA